MSTTPDFRGDLEGYLAYAEANALMRGHPQWCARHWAPCPVEGKNGFIASLAIMQRQIDVIPEAVRAEGAAAMNQWVENHSETPICCLLGDERVAQIWETA